MASTRKVAVVIIWLPLMLMMSKPLVAGPLCSRVAVSGLGAALFSLLMLTAVDRNGETDSSFLCYVAV
jgi:hypothetical protein